MKTTFVERTGKGSGINVADEIERRLTAAGLSPHRRKIPRSTLNRLLSSEAFRNRLGFAVRKGKFELTHSEEAVLPALRRVADDLANRRVVLGDIWDVDGKRSYLDKLETEGMLPTAADALGASRPGAASKPAAPAAARTLSPSRPARTTLIALDYGIAWPGRLQRHHAIWNELRYNLKLAEHPNAIAVLVRVLLELAVENYVLMTKLEAIERGDNLANRVRKVAEDLRSKGRIDDKYVSLLKKMQRQDELISMDTLNRYVHSPNFAPSPQHMTAIWDMLSDFIVLYINA